MAAGAGRRWPGRAGLQARGGAKCKLSAAQLRELAALLDAGPAVHGWDEDQCWTLARITEVVYRRFRVGYPLAGMDLLLHGSGGARRSPPCGTRRSSLLIWKRCAVLRGVLILASDGPARGPWRKAALLASLRDGFASLAPVSATTDFGACEE